MKQNEEVLRKKFDRISNAPSPNPRCEGMTPLEIAWTSMRPVKKSAKAAKWTEQASTISDSSHGFPCDNALATPTLRKPMTGMLAETGTSVRL